MTRVSEWQKVDSSQANLELLELMDRCKELDAEVEFHPQSKCVTVMVWRGWDSPDPQDRAKDIQLQIKVLAEQYPHVVCYCFDKYSTMLYVV